MPQIDLPPGNYRETRRTLRERVRHASRPLLIFTTLLAVWAAAVLVFFENLFPTAAPVWKYVFGLGPFALLWLVYALFDD